MGTRQLKYMGKANCEKNLRSKLHKLNGYMQRFSKVDKELAYSPR